MATPEKIRARQIEHVWLARQQEERRTLRQVQKSMKTVWQDRALDLRIRAKYAASFLHVCLTALHISCKMATHLNAARKEIRSGDYAIAREKFDICFDTYTLLGGQLNLLDGFLDRANGVNTQQKEPKDGTGL